jgi:D-glycerate 3-kinase
MHWERLTRHNLEEMPKRADLTLVLDKSHRIAEVLLKPSEA